MKLIIVALLAFSLSATAMANLGIIKQAHAADELGLILDRDLIDVQITGKNADKCTTFIATTSWTDDRGHRMPVSGQVCNGVVTFRYLK